MAKKVILAIIGTLLTAGLVVEVAYTVNNTSKKKSTNTITKDNTVVHSEINEVINTANEVEEEQNIEPEEPKQTEQKPKSTKTTSKAPSKSNTNTEEILEETQKPEEEEMPKEEQRTQKLTINLKNILTTKFEEKNNIKIVLEKDVLYDGKITDDIASYTTSIKATRPKSLAIYINNERLLIKTINFPKEGENIVINEW